MFLQSNDKLADETRRKNDRANYRGKKSRIKNASTTRRIKFRGNRLGIITLQEPARVLIHKDAIGIN